jgi:hypothetical protein
MATYKLAGITFTSKDAIKKHVRSIFDAYSVGQSLNDEHQKFVIELLQWHPMVEAKIGCGIARIEVHIPKPWTTKGFLIVRTNGSKTDFSYLLCLNPKLAEQHNKFKAACRTAIVYEISEFKQAAFAGRATIWSDVDGREITWAEAHADHYPTPFCELLDRYVSESGIDIKTVRFVEADGQTSAKFADARLQRDFANWHRANAQLRIISGNLNVKLGAHRRTA